MSNIEQHRLPEFEHLHLRDETQGWAHKDALGSIRYLEHGYPHSLVRWHYHEEYELHLIVDTGGKAFVGDYIGTFEPGHLVLAGPRLPHNWISLDVPQGGTSLRDIVVQFPHEPLGQVSALMTELNDLKPLLERARYGIEFFGISTQARVLMERVRDTLGTRRLAVFFELLDLLRDCSGYQTLSSAPMQSSEGSAQLARIDGIVSYVTEQFRSPLSMTDLAARAGMSDSGFSRLFHRATGNTFSGFVNRLRVNKACQLLAETKRPITDVCYDVGFNNVANFNRRFLQIKGVSPRDYRRQVRVRFDCPAGSAAESTPMR